jgi:hypothetical protein
MYGDVHMLQQGAAGAVFGLPFVERRARGAVVAADISARRTASYYRKIPMIYSSVKRLGSWSLRA